MNTPERTNTPAIHGLWHVSYTVSDLDASLGFYRDLLDCELVHRQRQANPYTARLTGFPDVDLDVAMLRLPRMPAGASGHHLELIQYLHPRGQKVDLITNNIGICHLAFAVDDIFAWHRRLSHAGVEFRSDPVVIEAGRNKGGWTVYFVDPDRIPLELVQPPHPDSNRWERSE